MKVKSQPIKYADLEQGIEFDVTIPNSERHKLQGKGLTNTFIKTVTIYNDIPADNVNPRRFDRAEINLCNIQNGLQVTADGTIQNVLNAITVISKDIDRYVSPLEYAALPVDLKDEHYTLQIGDFVVLDEVDDVVTTSREFAELQSKYKDNGFVIRSVATHINGMSVDNVQFANVG